jgi:endoglucanase
MNANLGSGLNVSSAWTLYDTNDPNSTITPDKDYFKIIKEAGFSHVRLPVKFSSYALKDKPYTLKSGFIKQLDCAVEAALCRELIVILTMDSYVEINKQLELEKPRFLSLWKQIAEHCKDYPNNKLLMEILNEPTDDFTPEKWNNLIVESLSTIRNTNPERYILVGPMSWYKTRYLKDLKLPADDQRLIVTFHYYRPTKFTHQGVPRMGAPGKKWIGTKWNANTREKMLMKMDFDQALTWSRNNKRPIYLGEFGTYFEADILSRTNWTKNVVANAKNRQYSWAYREFSGGFGAYDTEQKQWNKDLLKALKTPPTIRRIKKTTSKPTKQGK